MDKQKQFERKHFFINRRLQGRYMLTFLIPMIVMLGFLLFALYIAGQGLMKSTSDMIITDVDQIITIQLQDRAEPSAEVYETIIDGIQDYLRNIAREKKYRRMLINTLLCVIGIGIFLVIIQVALLTIFFSHKLAGPIYRFEKACHGLIDGDYGQFIKLRKGDEMHNLATLFNEAIKLTRERIVVLQGSDEQKKAEILSSIRL